MGLTLPNPDTAHRTNRLKDVCVFIPRDYDLGVQFLDHRVPGALPTL